MNDILNKYQNLLNSLGYFLKYISASIHNGKLKIYSNNIIVVKNCNLHDDVIFENLIFQNCTINGATTIGCNFRNCVIKNCNILSFDNTIPYISDEYSNSGNIVIDSKIYHNIYKPLNDSIIISTIGFPKKYDNMVNENIVIVAKSDILYYNRKDGIRLHETNDILKILNI